jgi:hypothetical protein
MSSRTITGNLAVDPEAVQAGRVQIVKLRVIENTGEYRAGEWTPPRGPDSAFRGSKVRTRRARARVTAQR